MTKNNLPAIHPGEFLSETLGELGISQAEFARAIGVSAMRISHVIKGTRPVTAELALLFGRALAQSSGGVRSENGGGEHRGSARWGAYTRTRLNS